VCDEILHRLDSLTIFCISYTKRFFVQFTSFINDPSFGHLDTCKRVTDRPRQTDRQTDSFAVAITQM